MDGRNPYFYFGDILSVYRQLLMNIADPDDPVVVQIEEPILVKNPSAEQLALVKSTYNELSSVSDNLRILVTTYFEHSCEAVRELTDTGVWGIGLDFIQGKKNLNCLDDMKDKVLAAGVVDGRNIWKTDFDKTLELLNEIAEKVPGERIIVSTSCSLLHVPYSLEKEPESGIRQWLSFGVEKAGETALLGKLFHGEELSREEKEMTAENRRALAGRSDSDLINNPAVSDRMKSIGRTVRNGEFCERIRLQRDILGLPSLPTTTIGSFPQTPEIRKVRRDYKKGLISTGEYESAVREYIDICVSFQEEIGLDVLVHGEPERNDMVEYFGEQLDGFHFTINGWVQSYGSRCVKPPVIYGDVSRPEPMTVKWISYAQSRTDKPMKGMLTGPVTIINWSFVRDDIPRAVIARQIALALSDEIRDLQEAGIKIIQVDEAAFKEGYPLREENVSAYEQWALESFGLSVSTAVKETQIHTHMCYSEFNDIIRTIEAMDADVITIETARSGNRLLRVFHETGYRNEIGPGVYDIHSPRIPSVDEFRDQISKRLEVVDLSRMWVNPDCGLKTRKWEEVKPALRNMVQAVREIR
jgi:5-methyltetrahydropteroyltriglutamate--homocysteine methyltransferase